MMFLQAVVSFIFTIMQAACQRTQEVLLFHSYMFYKGYFFIAQFSTIFNGKNEIHIKRKWRL